MKEFGKQAGSVQDFSAEGSPLFRKRVQSAQQRFNESVQAAYDARLDRGDQGNKDSPLSGKEVRP